MGMEDTVREFVDKLSRIDKLVDQVAGVKVDAKSRVVVDRGQRTMHGDDIIGDLGGMDFQPKLDAFGLENIKNRRPAVGKILIASVDVGLAGGREEIELSPHIAAGEAVDDVNAEKFGRARRVLDLFGAALAHTFRFTIAPQARGQNARMARINRVADALAYQVVANGEIFETILVQQIALFTHIAVAFQRFVHLKVVTPTGQLQAIEAPFADLLCQRGQRQIRPLAGKECNWSCHDFLLCNLFEYFWFSSPLSCHLLFRCRRPSGVTLNC